MSKLQIRNDVNSNLEEGSEREAFPFTRQIMTAFDCELLSRLVTRSDPLLHRDIHLAHKPAGCRHKARKSTPLDSVPSFL